jgi:DNA (cytosine-5)-methyltransferase 1
MNIKNNKKLKVLSLFSGCGGLDLGFINSGYEIIWANDFFIEAVETYKKNIGNHIVFGDISKIPNNEIPNNFDILLGGFPCQGFSVANKKEVWRMREIFYIKKCLELLKIKNLNFF